MLTAEQKEQKKADMLQKCFELFVAQGLENTSINDMAAYCKTYKAALYSYFKSKDDIVLECAKMYMNSLANIFDNEFEHPRKTLCDAMKRGFDVICGEKEKLRFIYQVISSPKYGDVCRKELAKIYSRYFEYSDVFAEHYHVNKEQFKLYFNLLVVTMHDYCLWENTRLVGEKLNYIFRRIKDIGEEM